jgi:hypothetical protein
VRLRSIFLTIANIFSLFITVIALMASPFSLAEEQPSEIPAWLRPYVGEGEGEIAQLALRRARALYLKKVSEGTVKNPCYFASERRPISPCAPNKHFFSRQSLL